MENTVCVLSWLRSDALSSSLLLDWSSCVRTAMISMYTYTQGKDTGEMAKKWQSKQKLLSRDSIQGENLELSRHNKCYCISSTNTILQDLVRIKLSTGCKITDLLFCFCLNKCSDKISVSVCFSP